MIKGGTLVYKCRKCGVLDKSYNVPDALRAIVCISSQIKTPKEWGITVGLFGIHFCLKDEMGLSDFIGIELD